MLSRKTIGILDVNNMYASCEAMWMPHLASRPVAVLSNNDGCVIARNQLLKDMGVPMGVPYFQVREMFARERVFVCSSNYALYGDMSRRVMDILEELAPEIEIYSIDEAFMDATGIEDPLAWASSVRSEVLKCTGLPNCIGLGPTKTLAKLANRIAKKARTTGVFQISADDIDLMATVEVGDVWGVGRRLQEHFKRQHILTAADLARADPRELRKQFGVTVERSVRELQGVMCFSLNEQPPHPSNIMVSRAFSRRVETWSDMREAVAAYAQRAAEKARQKGVYAEAVQVFIRTSPFGRTGNPYSNASTYEFAEARNDAGAVARAADIALRRIWRDGHAYQKAGVMLEGLVRPQARETSLFGGQQSEKSDRAMEILDGLNKRFGRGTVTIAAAGTRRTWSMARKMLTPAYTTRWSDLRVVR